MQLDAFVAASTPLAGREGEATGGSADGSAPGASAQSPRPASGDTPPEEATTQDAPPTFTSVTPSGIEVLYSPAPRRYYALRKQARMQGNVATAATDWFEVPSVTTILDVVNKGGLPSWGQRIGVEGVLELMRMGHKISSQAESEDILAELKFHGLDIDSVRDSAGDRGTNVHNALEAYLQGGWLYPETFLDSEEGYVRGLLGFLRDIEAGAFEPLQIETMVGSLQYGYAGRYDLRARLRNDVELQVTPKQKREVFPAGVYLFDLKTSSRVYDTHFFQLEAYEQANVECGYGSSDFRAVVRVTADGLYEVKRSKTATFGDFLTAKNLFDSLERQKTRRSK